MSGVGEGSAGLDLRDHALGIEGVLQPGGLCNEMGRVNEREKRGP